MSKANWVTVKGHKVLTMPIGTHGINLEFSEAAKAEAKKLWDAEIPDGMELTGMFTRKPFKTTHGNYVPESSAAIFKHETIGEDLGGLLLGNSGYLFAALTL